MRLWKAKTSLPSTRLYMWHKPEPPILFSPRCSRQCLGLPSRRPFAPHMCKHRHTVEGCGGREKPSRTLTTMLGGGGEGVEGRASSYGVSSGILKLWLPLQEQKNSVYRNQNKPPPPFISFIPNPARSHHIPPPPSCPFPASSLFLFLP